MSTRIQNTDANVAVTALSSSSFAETFGDGTLNQAKVVACTVSGTTPTCGTPTNAGGGGYAPAYFSISSLSSSALVVAYLQAYSNVSPPPIPYAVRATACTISGTSVSCGSPSTIAGNTTTSSDINAGSYVSLSVLSSTNFIVGYLDPSLKQVRASASTVSGTTITPNNSYIISSTLSNYNYITIADLDSTHYVYGFVDGNNYPNASVGVVTNPTVLGMATNAASANGTVTVASTGIVGGLSGLTAGNTYFWSPAGGLSTSTSAYQVGLALTSSSMLLNSNNNATGDQFFGDAVFANNFRIAESPDTPQGLTFKNQLGKNIAVLDEDGNLNLTGQILASNINQNTFNLLGTTSVVELTTATSTNATSTPEWAGVFANASDGLKTVLQSIGNEVVEVMGKAIYASVGVFDKVFAKEVDTDQLCITDATGKTCVTRTQLNNLLNGTATSTPQGTGGVSSGGGDSSGSATSTPPTITLIGADPAQLNVGDTYIDPGVTVTSTSSPNIGYSMSLDGATSTSPAQFTLDTSTPGTHIILFSATDGAGNTGTATRTIIVSLPAQAGAATSTQQ